MTETNPATAIRPLHREPNMRGMRHLLSDVFAGRVSAHPCEHQSYDVLRNFGDQMSSVEEMDARCRGCGELVNVQITSFSNGPSVDVWPMTPEQIARKGYEMKVMR